MKLFVKDIPEMERITKTDMSADQAKKMILNSAVLINSKYSVIIVEIDNNDIILEEEDHFESYYLGKSKDFEVKLLVNYSIKDNEVKKEIEEIYIRNYFGLMDATAFWKDKKLAKLKLAKVQTRHLERIIDRHLIWDIE